MLVSSKRYLLSSLVEIVDLILTEACDPEPKVEQSKECILDANGQEWTEVLILDVTDPNSPIVTNTLYYDAEQSL